MNPDLIHNEQTKLTATWLNTIGSASLVVGVVTPVGATVYGLSSGAHLNWTLLAVAIIWLLAGTGIPLLARRVLRRLRP